MSSIEQMSIQGIRSFGPNDTERQIIKFFKPLTLILGPNGTGKTTIIECLNYLTTGEMPPGVGKGAVFVHDPKVAHEMEVKGQVRLQIKDIHNNKLVVQRSMKTTQKAKKVEFQTLDGVITRWKPSGDKVSISSRCAEIDKEMINALGVSKSILNNVVFCHQEDSLWPLSEGKVLKQKFDNIFAATKYIKALNAINDIKKNQKTEIKLYSAELKYLKENKEFTEELEENLSKTETRYNTAKEKITQKQNEIYPIQGKLNHFQLKKDEYLTYKTQIFKIKNEMSHLHGTIQTVSAKLTSPKYFYIDDNFKGNKSTTNNIIEIYLKYIENYGIENVSHYNSLTTNDGIQLKVVMARVQKALAEHETDLKLNDDQVKSIESRLIGIEKHCSSIENQISNLNTRKTEHERELNNYISLLDQRDSYVKDSFESTLKSKNINNQIKIYFSKLKNPNAINHALNSKTSTNELIANCTSEITLCDLFIKEFETYITQINAEQTIEKEQIDIKLNELKDRVNTTREAKAKLEADYAHQFSQLDAHQNEIQTITKRLTELSSDEQKSEVIDKEIRKIEFELKREITGSSLTSPNFDNTHLSSSTTNFESPSKYSNTTNKGSLDSFNETSNKPLTTEVKLRREISSAQSAKAKLTVKLNAINAEINRLHETASLDNTVRMLSKESETKRAELHALKEGKLKGWQAILNKNKDPKFQMPDVESDGDTRIQNVLEEFLKMHSKSVLRCQNKVRESNLQIGTWEIERKHMDKRIAELEIQIKEKKEKTDSNESSASYSKFKELEKRLDEQIERRGGLISSKTIYAKFVERLRIHKCCPICDRDFSGDSAENSEISQRNTNELTELIADLERRLSLIPDKLSETNALISKLKIDYHKGMASNKDGQNAAINQIRDEELPGLKSELTVLNGKLEKAGNLLKEDQKLLDALLAQESKAREYLMHAILADKLAMDIRDLEERCALEKQKLPSDETGHERTLAAVLEEKEELDMRLDGLNREIEFKKTKLGNHIDRVQKLEKHSNALQSDKLKLQLAFAGRAGLETKRAELTQAIETIKSSTKTLEPQMEPLNRELTELDEQSCQLNLEKDASQSRSWQRCETVRKHVTYLSQAIKAPLLKFRDKWAAQNQQASMYLTNTNMNVDISSCSFDDLDQQIASLTDRLSKLRAEFKELTAKLDTAKSTSSNAKVIERDLTDALQCLRWCGEIEEKLFILNELQTKTQSLNIDERQMESLQTHLDKLEADINQLNGMSCELVREIARLKATLQSDTYRLSKQKYKEYLIKYRTTQLALKDLTIYHKAFDRAIMTYHTLKMGEINKIVRQLWKQTYRGSDIDYIEIRSDLGGEDGNMLVDRAFNLNTNAGDDSDPDFDMNAAENYSVVSKSSKASASRGRGRGRGVIGRRGNAAKRAKTDGMDSIQSEQAAAAQMYMSSVGSAQRAVYNYRVVMVRNGVELDMRNRCSAGQKVLASLIIRLALAETFCLNCGILALDEPTTNLDQENIESLAYALIDIINERSVQRNFQLIIITHDEDFINLLGQADFVDNYYQLGKNINGSSTISKVNFRS